MKKTTLTLISTLALLFCINIAQATATNYGQVAYAPPLVNPVVFTNPEGSDVQITRIVLQGDREFYLSNQFSETWSTACGRPSQAEPTVVEPGNSCTVAVAFQPTQSNNYRAIVKFFSAETLLYSKTLVGTGTPSSCGDVIATEVIEITDNEHQAVDEEVLPEDDDNE
ncbi:MAG: hypothetical protein ABII18_14030 [bacterium]|nr:hypothetical protein [bacterium]MBU1918400.1 hypothetical protein [bacterium]